MCIRDSLRAAVPFYIGGTLMKEVKTPKKPLIFYYAVAMLAVFLFNFFAMPWLAQHQICLLYTSRCV